MEELWAQNTRVSAGSDATKRSTTRCTRSAMENLLFLAIAPFGSAEQFDPLTQKFSLFN
jgi:hypothetical protein